MTPVQIVVLVYGVFTLVGGIIGFVKAKSKASLIAGSISGILLLICVGGMKNEIQFFYVLAGFISIALGVRFFRTWLVKKKVMPDLIMVILSLLSLIAIVFGR